jgi:hypothetical protein
VIQLEEKEEIAPLCPHCETEIRRVWFQKIPGVAGKRYLYYCSNCRKALGVSHRKGFWMG